MTQDTKNPGKVICYMCRRRFDESEVNAYWAEVEQQRNNAKTGDVISAEALRPLEPEESTGVLEVPESSTPQELQEPPVLPEPVVVGITETPTNEEAPAPKNKKEKKDKSKKKTKLVIIIAVLALLIAGGTFVFTLLGENNEPVSNTVPWNDMPVKIDNIEIKVGETTLGELLGNEEWKCEHEASVPKTLPAGMTRDIIRLSKAASGKGAGEWIVVGVHNPTSEVIKIDDAVINKLEVVSHPGGRESSGSRSAEVTLGKDVTVGSTTLAQVIDMYGQPNALSENKGVSIASYFDQDKTWSLELSARSTDSVVYKFSLQTSAAR